MNSLVVIDARPLQAGTRYQGTGTYLSGLLEGFRHVGAAERILLLTDRRLPEPATAGFRVLPVRRPGWPERLAEGWNQLLTPLDLRRAGATVYHAPAPELAVVAAPCARVVTIHDLVAFRFAEEHLRTGVKYRALYRAAATAEAVVVPSERTRRDVLERYPSARVHVVAHGVDSRFFVDVSPERAGALAGRFGVRPPYVLCVGDLGSVSHNARKNLMALLDAFAAVDVDGWTLVLAGREGAYAERLARRGEELGVANRLMFPGFVPAEDLPALYAGAELLAYPSLYEGFGLPVLEALAVGTPVLAGTEAVPDDATSALVHATDGTPDDLRQILDGLLRNAEERTRHVAAGRRHARGYRWEKTAPQMLDLYDGAA